MNIDKININSNESTKKDIKKDNIDTESCKYYDLLTKDGISLLTYLLSDILINTDEKSIPSLIKYIEEYPIDLRKYLFDNIMKNAKTKIKPCETFFNVFIKYILENAYGFSNDKFITSYDICVSICFSEELYVIFGNKIPIFPYRDVDLYDKSIEYVFGKDLPFGIKEPLVNYLQYTLSLYQNLPYEDFKSIVHRNSVNKFNARLNLAGELMLITCSKIKENYKKLYGKEWEKNFNFLTFLNSLRDIKI